MILTDRAARSLILNNAEACGVKLPAAIKAAETLAERIAANAATLRPSHNELAAAVATAFAEDRDPTTDPGVQRLAVANTIASNGLPAKVADEATEDLRDAYRRHADAILAAFAVAADQLAASAAILGDADLNDTAALKSGGPAAAEAWSVAHDALKTVDACAQAFNGLMSYTRLRHLNPHLSGLRFAAVDWHTWTSNGWGNEYQRVSAWDLVKAGVRLSFPASVAEYEERVQAIAQGHQQAVADAERRNTEALMNR